MIRVFGIALVLGLAFLGGWLGRGWSTPAPATDAETTPTCRVARGRLEQNVKSTVGYIKPAPNALVRVGFPAPKDVSRAISQLTVQEGDQVSPGALLALLDHEDLTLAREQLTAELRVSTSRLETLKELEPLEIGLAEALLAERMAQRDQAERHYQRKLSLSKNKLVTAAELEDAAQTLDVTRAKYTQAETGLQQVRTRFRTDRAVLENQIHQTKTALQAIAVQTRWRELRSPLAVPAQVFAVHQRQGEVAGGQPHLPVLTLLDPSQLQAHLYIAEADFGRIHLEQPVSLRATSYPNRILRGRIVRLLPQPVIQDNVVYYLAVVEVAPEERSLLRVDMSVTAHIQAGVKQNALWLPLRAIRSGRDGWYVLRRGSTGPTEVLVRIGWQDQGRVEIREGLTEGDEVLVQP
jgi:HlyD family secretion protein/macrolide-specific efflux system membrane fusion protein